MSRRESNFVSWFAEPLELVIHDPSSTVLDQPLTSCQGRTTFVNTLCGRELLAGRDSDDAANAHIQEGIQIKPVSVGKTDTQQDCSGYY